MVHIRKTSVQCDWLSVDIYMVSAICKVIYLVIYLVRPYQESPDPA